jgi:hypothetical protein
MTRSQLNHEGHEGHRARQSFKLGEGWRAQRLGDGRGCLGDRYATTPFEDSGRATQVE